MAWNLFRLPFATFLNTGFHSLDLDSARHGVAKPFLRHSSQPFLRHSSQACPSSNEVILCKRPLLWTARKSRAIWFLVWCEGVLAKSQSIVLKSFGFLDLTDLSSTSQNQSLWILWASWRLGLSTLPGPDHPRLHLTISKTSEATTLRARRQSGLCKKKINVHS